MCIRRTYRVNAISRIARSSCWQLMFVALAWKHVLCSASTSDVMSPRHVSSSLIWLAETSRGSVSPRCHLWSMANRIAREICPPDIPRVSQHLMLWRWYLKFNQVVAASVPKTKRNQNMFLLHAGCFGATYGKL